LTKKAGKEDREDAAHHVLADTEMKLALLVAQVCNIVRTPESLAQGLFLNQERVFLEKYDDGAWILDTGATNHMTGCRLLDILNVTTKSRLSVLILITAPKMPNLSLMPLKPSCHPQHDMRDAVLKYAIALLNK